MSILEKTLRNSKENKTIIGIRMYGDDTKFWCGYIVNFNLDFFILQHYSKNGIADGFILEMMENVESVDLEDKYSHTFQKLISKTENNFNDSTFIKIPTTDEWQVEFLSNCNSNKLTVAIDFKDDFTISGKIVETDTEFVKIEAISDLGELDGYSIYRVLDIESIRVYSLELNKREHLLNENQTISKKN